MSCQLDQYLQLRANGSSQAGASIAVGMSRIEADLTEKAIAEGHLSLLPLRGMMMPKHDNLDAPEELPEADDPLVELAAETLHGDCRDSLLAWFKAQPKSWPFMAEREQRDLADAADRYAYTIVKEACRIIAAGERPTIVARLIEYREKDGIEAKLKLPSTGECVAALHEACGREVLLVTSGAEDFLEEAGPAEISPDQPGFGIGDEYEEAA